MKDVDGNDIGMPFFIWLLIFGLAIGILLTLDENIGFIAFIVFLSAVLIVQLDAVIGNRIPRRGKVLKKHLKGTFLCPYIAPNTCWGLFE